MKLYAIHMDKRTCYGGYFSFDGERVVFRPIIKKLGCRTVRIRCKDIIKVEKRPMPFVFDDITEIFTKNRNSYKFYAVGGDLYEFLLANS